MKLRFVEQKRVVAVVGRLVVEVVRSASVGIVAVLSLTGSLAAWQLAVVALVGGIMAGLYYPAYSALLPSVLPEDELMAANGFEGMARPVLMQAGGPALARRTGPARSRPIRTARICNVLLAGVDNVPRARGHTRFVHFERRST